MNRWQHLKAAFGLVGEKSNLLGGSRSRRNAPFAYRLVNGAVQLYDTRTATLIEESYLKNTHLYAVVRFITRKGQRAVWTLNEVKDEKAFRKYKALTGEDATIESIAAARGLRSKALDEVTGEHQIKKLLLERPNPYQKPSEFIETALAYRLLTGERFLQRVSGLYPVSEIYALPPTLMKIEADQAYLAIKKYVYLPTVTELPPDEVVFSKTFHPATRGYGQELRGLSPLQVLALTIQELNEGQKQGITQFQNGAPLGIAFDDSSEKGGEPLTSDQADQLQERFARDQGKIAVTSARLGWHQVGISPVDLNLIETRKFSQQDICNAYGLDYRLFGADSTFNNKAEAKKAAILDAVVPELLELRADFNQLLAVPFSKKDGKRYFIDCDVTDFPEMQEDMNALVDRLTKAWMVTPNQVLEAMQYEPHANPMMDEPWIPAGITPLSEFVAGQEQRLNPEPANDGSIP